MDTRAAIQVNLDSDAALRDPAAYFASFRDGSEVQWSDAQRGWVALSHAAVEAGFRDDERLSSDRSASFRRAVAGYPEASQEIAELLSGWMNFRDPPMHTHLREPVKSAFSPRAIGALEADVQAIVDGVIDAFDGESADLSHDFARPIPALVIGAVLGVPAEDRHRFYKWSHDLGQLVFSVTPGGAPHESVGAATTEFSAFFSRLIDRERSHPTGTLLSAIVAHESALTPGELVGACTMLLFGGHETTTTLLVNALGILLERPDMLAWLREHPGADGSAVEEFTRVQGPARALPRKVKVTHERAGQELRAGQNIFLCIASANHDEAVFERPGEIDLLRSPNPHLGFGWGLHYCLGASLARMEARIALRTLIERFPALTADGAVPPPRASTMGYGRRPLRVKLRG